MQVKRFAPLLVVGILGLLLADGILGLVLAVGIIGPLLAADILDIGLPGRKQDVHSLLQLKELFKDILRGLLIELLRGVLHHLKELEIEVGHNLANHCIMDIRRLTGSRQRPRICFQGLDLPGIC